MKLRNRSTVQLVLQGGLGNQLFQYFAALYINTKSIKHFEINTSIVGKHGANHGISILDLDLPGRFVNNPGLFTTIGTARIVGAITRKSKFARRIHAKFWSSYFSKTVGYDPNLEEIQPPVLLKGYFQSYRFVEGQSWVNPATVTLRSPSAKYQDLIRIMNMSNVTALHIRRGDYLEHLQDFGVLDKDYYLRALSEINKIQPGNEIWVFSDDIEKVRREFENLMPESTKWIGHEAGLSPAETLLIMSAASNIIISNSTFSWWAAYLGRPKRVFAPKKWYRSLEDPIEIIPSNWTQITSSWIA